MTKVSISSKRCFFHSDERAATCQTCYDLALEQQRTQVARQREQAHAQYLRLRQGVPAALEFLRTSRQHLEIDS